MGREQPPCRGQWSLELKGPGRGWTGKARSRGPGTCQVGRGCCPVLRTWPPSSGGFGRPPASTGRAVWEESTQLRPRVVGDEAEQCPPNRVHMDLRREPHVEGESAGRGQRDWSGPQSWDRCSRKSRETRTRHRVGWGGPAMSGGWEAGSLGSGGSGTGGLPARASGRTFHSRLLASRAVRGSPALRSPLVCWEPAGRPQMQGQQHMEGAGRTVREDAGVRAWLLAGGWRGPGLLGSCSWCRL